VGPEDSDYEVSGREDHEDEYPRTRSDSPRRSGVKRSNQRMYGEGPSDGGIMYGEGAPSATAFHRPGSLTGGSWLDLAKMVKSASSNPLAQLAYETGRIHRDFERSTRADSGFKVIGPASAKPSTAPSKPLDNRPLPSPNAYLDDVLKGAEYGAKQQTELSAGLPRKLTQDDAPGTMTGEGFFDDSLVNTAFRRIANELTNPDSILGSTVRAVDNEFTNPDSELRRAGRLVENEFVNPNSQFRTTALSPEVNNIITDLQTHDWGPLKDQFEKALDPNKNGLADAYRMLNGDKTELFNFIKDNLSKVARENKAGFDNAFRPLLHAFGEDRALSDLIGQHIQGFPQTREDWERVMKDPDTYFDILSVMISVAAVVTTGPAAPATIAASRAALTAARVLTHAAQGKVITNAELAAVVADIVLPYRTGAFKDLPKLAQAGGIALKSDAMKIGTAKVAEFAGQVASNYFPGAAVLLTELATDRSAPAAAAAVGALQSLEDAPAAPEAQDQAAQPGAAVPGEAGQPPAPVAAAPAASPAVRPAQAAPPQRAVGPSAVSRSAARAAAPPMAAPVAPAVRPLQPLPVPSPIFNEGLANIPISGRSAARLNRMARVPERASSGFARNVVSRRGIERAETARMEELARVEAENETDSMRRAAAIDAFMRSRAYDEEVRNRFAFSPLV
jgi:hypothetical protein